VRLEVVAAEGILGAQGVDRFGEPKLTLLRPPVVRTGGLSLTILSVPMVTEAA
jgi:hypothetical protein